MTGIDIVWTRIKAHGGEKFHRIQGGEFTYDVVGVKPDRTNQQIPKSNFEEALSYLPLQNTVPVQHLRVPSYIYAILMDKCIIRYIGVLAKWHNLKSGASTVGA